MKSKKQNYLFLGLGIGWIVFVLLLFYNLFFSNSQLDNKKDVLRYLKKNYKNESFIVKDKSVKKITNESGCGDYDEYTWIVSSNDSGIEFEVISGYHYAGTFVCQEYNHDTYKLKIIDNYISKNATIKMSRNGYGDISFNQNELPDEDFIEAIYKTITDLRNEYPFKDNNVSIEVDIFMNNGTKRYLKLKDITSLSYLKNILK